MLKMSSKINLHVGAAVFAAIMLAVIVPGIFICRGDRIFSGVSVAGISLGGLTEEAAEDMLRQAGVEPPDITLRYKKSVYHPKADELGIRLNSTACAKAAFAVGRNGGILHRTASILYARYKGADIPPAFTLDKNSAKAYLAALAVRVDRSPADARLVEEDGALRILPSAYGLKLDIPETLEELSAAISSGEHDAGLVVLTAEPEVRESDLAEIDGVLASYTTAFKPYQRDRTHNLGIACRAIDGTLVKPGQTFSYNKEVGPRLKKYGYRDAPIFVNGEVEPGLGGGICQVCTTIYNAALLSNMQIQRRSHHSRPVAYAPLGRDATVAYPSVDLKFKNTSDAPVYIAVSMGTRTMTVVFYSKKVPGREVVLATSGRQVIYAKTIHRVDPSLAAGARIVEEPGLNGYRINLYRIIKQDGRIIQQELISKDYYRPQKRIVAVAPAETPPAHEE